MTPYPKHYLADVPHDLRMRVLDLCIHRQWHDALDLLQQNGFTQYQWYELVWFHDHAPANLPSSTGSTGDPPVPVGDPPTGIAEHPERQTENPEPLTLQSETLTAHCGPLTVKARKPRSKIARLPRPIQHNLNSMLASGHPYRDIVHYLDAQGHPGFNKVNLHTWKSTGFQDWLRGQNPDPNCDPEGRGRSYTATGGDNPFSHDHRSLAPRKSCDGLE